MMGKPVTGPALGVLEEFEEEEEQRGKWFKGYFSSLTPGSEIGGYQRVYVQLPGADRREPVVLDFSTDNLVVDVTLAPLVTEETRLGLELVAGQMNWVERVRRKSIETPRLTYLDDEGNLQTVWRTRDEMAATLAERVARGFE